MNTKISSCLTYGLLFMFFLGCAPTISAQPTVIPTLSPISTASSTSIPSPTASVVPTATPSLHFFYPKVKKLCPKNREVSIDKLGISNNLKVILSDSNQTGLWSLDVENPSPQLIQKLALDKWISESISPDGKLLAYNIWNPDLSSSTWIYDLANNTQREVSIFKNWDGFMPSLTWLSTQDLLIHNISYQRSPLYVVNAYTGDLVDVSDVDSEPYDEYQAFYVDEGNYFALYSAGNIGNDYIDFYVYDYSTRQKIRALPWLQDRIFFYPYVGTNLGLEFDLDKIFMIVEQSYGYDLGFVDSSIEALTQSTPYDALMKRVATDIYFGKLDFSFIALNPSINSLILSMSYTDFVNNDFDSEPKKIENAFFLLDLEHPVIDPRIDYLLFTDYCFTTTGYYMNEISPDGKIVVLNSDSNIILLNLETGYLARLKNWRFISWAKK
ncbi:MAG: hypothetical protein ABI904_00195 [Chloroflexota bacterium]